MDLNFQPMEHAGAVQGTISHYELDFRRNGNSHYYIWRHRPFGDTGKGKISMLIDLDNVYVPDQEIEKMIFGFVLSTAGVISIAFANCHSHNQQEIKRKLKASDIKLYSKTAFFTDTQKAKQWLETQSAIR